MKSVKLKMTALKVSSFIIEERHEVKGGATQTICIDCNNGLPWDTIELTCGSTEPASHVC